MIINWTDYDMMTTEQKKQLFTLWLDNVVKLHELLIKNKEIIIRPEGNDDDLVLSNSDVMYSNEVQLHSSDNFKELKNVLGDSITINKENRDDDSTVLPEYSFPYEYSFMYKGIRFFTLGEN